MHPVLLELGRLRIYSYGFMLALSFWIGIVWAARRAKRAGIRSDRIYDLSVVLIVSAIVGARLLYIAMHRREYGSFLDVIALWQGGAVFYGGFLLALAGALIYLRKVNLSFFAVADICAPPIALGLGITRIGCFLSGCCFGAPTDSFLGVVFPAGCPAGYHAPGIALHPTQLYESAYGFVIAALLLVLERRSKFSGFTFAFLCILYGVARAINDSFRYYEPDSRIYGAMALSQVISALLAVTGIAVLVILSRRREP